MSTVLELCRTRLPDNMHIPAEQIQVLTPTRKGPCGTINLNRLLQEALNPKAPGKREILWGERVFRVGDRIMQTRNDYDVVWEKADGTVGTGMFNGDVGRIAEIDAERRVAGAGFRRPEAPSTAWRCSARSTWPMPRRSTRPKAASTAAWCWRPCPPPRD